MYFSISRAPWALIMQNTASCLSVALYQRIAPLMRMFCRSFDYNPSLTSLLLFPYSNAVAIAVRRPGITRERTLISDSEEPSEPVDAFTNQALPFVPETETEEMQSNAMELQSFPTESTLHPTVNRRPRQSKTDNMRKQSSVARNSGDVAEKLRRNPQLQLVSSKLNNEEKELFIVVREGDTQRAIEILQNSEVQVNDNIPCPVKFVDRDLYFEIKLQSG